MITDNGKTIFIEADSALSQQELYQLWAIPENVPKWWNPNVKEWEADYREGGDFRVHWKEYENLSRCPYGQFKKIIENQQIIMSWKWDSISPDFESEIEMRFSATESGSKIQFWHRGIDVPGEVESHHNAWVEIVKLLCQFRF